MTASTCPIEFRIESTNDIEQPFTWTVQAAGGVRKLAYAETYVSSQGVDNAVAAVRSGNATYDDPEKATNGKWYFHIQGLNNRILARSAYMYATEAEALADRDLIAVNAANAPYYDYVAVK